MCDTCQDANHQLLHDWIMKHPFTRQTGFQECHAEILHNITDKKVAEIVASAIGAYTFTASQCDFCAEKSFGHLSAPRLFGQKAICFRALRLHPMLLMQPVSARHATVINVATNRDPVFEHGICTDRFNERQSHMRSPMLSDVLKLLDCKRKGNFRLTNLSMVSFANSEMEKYLADADEKADEEDNEQETDEQKEDIGRLFKNYASMVTAKLATGIETRINRPELGARDEVTRCDFCNGVRVALVRVYFGHVTTACMSTPMRIACHAAFVTLQKQAVS
jgi:hypothetical protein